MPTNYKQPVDYYLQLFTHLYRQGYYTNAISGEAYGEGTYGAGGYGGGSEDSTWSEFKIIRWARQVFSLIDNLTNCASTFNSNLSLNNSVGNQLDMLGQILNCPRRVNFQPTGGVSPVLDDVTYAILLKATIARDAWDGTMVGLFTAWKSIFPTGSIQIIDNQNMTADITLTGTFSSIIIDLINNGYIVPRPEGVEYIFATGGDLPYFGCDVITSFIAGVDAGHIT